MRTQQQLCRDSKFKKLLGDNTPNCTVGDAITGNVAVAIAGGRVGSRPKEGGGVAGLLFPISAKGERRWPNSLQPQRLAFGELAAGGSGGEASNVIVGDAAGEPVTC